MKYLCAAACVVLSVAAGIAVPVVSEAFGVVTAQVSTVPEAPRILLDTAYVPPTGTTITLRAGDSLQAALDSAQPGDEIVLEAGAVFTGNFTLAGKPGSRWITIRSSNMSGITASGVRVAPSNASSMPKIITPNSSPVLTARAGSTTSAEAHHYRFMGVEFRAVSNIVNLIKLGDTGAAQCRLDQVPHDLIFDRCYIHGGAALALRRGIAMNSAGTAIVDSYISDCHEIGADSQAIACWNGPGPFKISNNYLEGAGENVMFGGADPSIPGLIPADIEFRKNQCKKPLSWKIGDPSYAGRPWTVKNLFELKNAQRVLIEGNLFEGVWLEGQTGSAVVIKSVNQDGAAPWSVTQDVEFRNNIVRHVGGALNIQGRAYDQPGGQTKRVSVRNNLFYDVSNSVWNGEGAFLKIAETIDVRVDHNTVIQSGNIIVAYGQPAAGFIFTNNIATNNLYGVKGDSCSTGSGTLNIYFPGCLFRKNAIAGGQLAAYPADNFFPATLDEVGFVDRTASNFRLLIASTLNSAGTDGLDVGANIDAIEAAMAGESPAAPALRTEIVLYASEAAVKSGYWLVTPDVSAAGGVRLANPDFGAPKLDAALTQPFNYFEMTFEAHSGTPYRLWIRGKAQDNSPYNDSVYIQFSGSVDSRGATIYRIGSTSAATVNLEEYLNRRVRGWGWQDNGWGDGVLGPLIYFQASGTQTLRVQLREDGLSIDQIVLSAGVFLNSAPGALKNDITVLPRTD